MSDIAIRVENLSKQYRIGSAQLVLYKTLRDALTAWLPRLSCSVAKAAVGGDNARW